MTEDRIQYIDITLLQPNPFQPRNKINPEELEELISSIKQYGILESLTVAETPVGYQIVAGERRWRAAKKAGLKKVPAIIKKTSPRGMLEMAIIENVQRIDLHPVERAKAFQQLMREFKYTTSQVAEKVSKSASYVSNSLKLLALPDAVKDGLIGNLISEGHARAIAGISDIKTMIQVYKQILKEGGSVRRAEELARDAKARLNQTETPEKRSKLTQAERAEMLAWEKRLNQLLAVKSKVKLSRSNRQTRVTITLKGSPEETADDLQKIMDQIS